MCNCDDSGRDLPAAKPATPPEAADETVGGGRYGHDVATLRERALSALRDGKFDLAEQLLDARDPSLDELVENLRIYQAELEIQNEELKRSQRAAEQALTRFTELFNRLPIAELVLDHHGLIVEANPEARRLLGLRDTSFHQYFLSRLLDRKDQARIIGTLDRLQQEKSAELVEARFGAGDPDSLIADLHIARLPKQDGLLPRFVCAIVDRTEEVRQREALGQAYDRLESSRERYRVLAEFSPEWDYWLGTDRRFVHVSPACLDTTGYSADEFLKDPDLLERIIHADDLAAWRRHLEAPGDQDRDQPPLLFRIRTRDGRERWIEHVCGPITAEDGRDLGRRGVNRDVTSRREAEDALRRSEALLNATGHLARVGGWECDTAGNSLRWTPITRALYEVDDDFEPDLEATLRFYHPDDRDLLRKAIEHTLSDGVPYKLELRLHTAKGRELWVKTTGEAIVEAGCIHGLRGSIQDVTEQRAAETRAGQAHSVFETTSEGILVTDPQQQILAVNGAFSKITGYREDELLGRKPSLLKSGRHDQAFYKAMWTALTTTGKWRGEIWNRRKNGEIYPQLSTISAVRDSSGRLTNYVGVFGDITHHKQSEEGLYELAHTDALTHLPNRALLRARLEQSLRRAERDGGLLALLFLDLDLFKNVNDSLGHPVGDALLQHVADAMAERVRAADTLARLGGDEFVVLMEDLPDPSLAAQLSRRLLEVFAEPFEVMGRQLFITASIGISVYPMDGRDMDTLLGNADVAMYQAKERGRNTYRFFEAAMTAGAMERQELETALRGAMDRQELNLVYQPQIKLLDRSLCGAEALVRWYHPELGQIPPARFIPIAEKLGIAAEVGIWVLEHACAQLAAWDARGFPVPRLAVNLSVQQLERGDLARTVAAILAQAGLDADRLGLEVTESMLVRRDDQVIRNLRALRDLGITIAVDDFGSGYSSLGYLKHLPINRLKIDQTFVDNLTKDPSDDGIARTVIALGRGLGLEVAAEGVETEAQAEFLVREHCSEAQGYLFGRPMTAAHLLDFQRSTTTIPD